MTRTRRIVLHPGFHRTGCRSVQSFFATNRDVLAPNTHCLFVADLRPILRLMRGDGAVSPSSLKRAMGILFPDPASDQRDILISSEALSGPPPGRADTIDYNAAAAQVGMIGAALLDHFAGSELTVALTVRQAEDWLFAAYQSQLLHSRIRLSRAAFAGAHRRATDFERLGTETAAALQGYPDRARVLLLPIEDTKSHALGPGGALVDLLQPDPALRSRLRPVAHVDHSLPPPYWLTFLELNRSRRPDDEVRTAKDALLTHYRHSLSNAPPTD